MADRWYFIDLSDEIDPALPPRPQLVTSLVLAIVATYAASFLAISATTPEEHWLTGDEAHFVITIRGFVIDFSWERLRTYEEMSTPGPFLLYAVWGKCFGTGIVSLRLANLIVGLVAVTLSFDFFRLTLRANRLPLLAGVYFAAFPYTLYLSLFVHTDMLAIACLLAGWSAILRRQYLLSTIAMAGALWCRQYLVFAVLAGGLEGLMQVVRDRNRGGWQLMGAMTASVTPLFVLIGWWGGMTPDNQLQNVYISERLRFHVDSLMVYLALFPWFALPCLLWSRRAQWRTAAEVCAGVLGAVLPFLFPIRASAPSLAVNIPTIGLFHRLIRAVCGNGILEQIPFSLGLGVACAHVPRQWRAICGSSQQPMITRPRFLVLQWWSFLAVMPWSYLHWEKYLLPVFPILILLGLISRNGSGESADLRSPADTQ